MQLRLVDVDEAREPLFEVSEVVKFGDPTMVGTVVPSWWIVPAEVVRYNLFVGWAVGEHVMKPSRFSPVLVVCLVSQAFALDPNVAGSVFVRVADVGAGLCCVVKMPGPHYLHLRCRELRRRGPDRYGHFPGQLHRFAMTIAAKSSLGGSPRIRCCDRWATQTVD